jgi:hypothetical protein
VLAGIIVTLCAAVAPPFAERAAKDGQPLKAALLWLFFGLAVGFSLTASIARSSGYSEARTAGVEQSNEKARLAKEAYEAAQEARKDECATGRGPKCRELETAVTDARKALAMAAPVQSSDPGSERLSAVLGVDQGKVQLYAPLLLPLGLELGGFTFLAAGLAPRRREDEIAPEPDASPAPAVAKTAKKSAAVAKLLRDAAKPAAKTGAVGTRAYYLARLECEAPDFARRVHDGEMSVYAASIAAGIRKAPAKRKWDAADYAKRECAIA